MTILSPESTNIPQRLYRLRWRFDFADRKSSKGTWNNSGGQGAPKAWEVNKTNLVRACIEGENLFTSEKVCFLELMGSEYAFSQWEGYVNSPTFLRVQSLSLAPQIWGLSFLTQNKKITIDISGSQTSRDLTEDEKKFNFKEHKI